MSQKELSECDPNELFEAYCLEPDERKAIDIIDELFERIVTLRSYQLPNGKMYYEYLPDNVFFCCDKMRDDGEAHTLNLIASTSKSVSDGILWEATCPYCGTKLIVTPRSIRKGEEMLLIKCGGPK